MACMFILKKALGRSLAGAFEMMPTRASLLVNQLVQRVASLPGDNGRRFREPQLDFTLRGINRIRSMATIAASNQAKVSSDGSREGSHGIRLEWKGRNGIRWAMSVLEPEPSERSGVGWGGESERGSKGMRLEREHTRTWQTALQRYYRPCHP